MAEGQFLGSKRTYIYVADDNRTYRILRDRTLGDLSGTALNPGTPGVQAGRLPRNFKPRGVYWQSNELQGRNYGRKFIICNRDGTLYTSTDTVSLTIDGIPGQTTGRRGESASYLQDDPEVVGP